MDIDPFDNVISSTENLVSYTADTPLSVTNLGLSFRWDPSGEPDLKFIFNSARSRAVVARIDYIEPVVLEPSSLLLVGISLWLILANRRSRRLVKIAVSYGHPRSSRDNAANHEPYSSVDLISIVR